MGGIYFPSSYVYKRRERKIKLIYHYTFLGGEKWNKKIPLIYLDIQQALDLTEICVWTHLERAAIEYIRNYKVYILLAYQIVDFINLNPMGCLSCGRWCTTVTDVMN